jgi:hypothetical protein
VGECQSMDLFGGNLARLPGQVPLEDRSAAGAQIGSLFHHARRNARNIRNLGAAKAHRIPRAHLLRLRAESKAWCRQRRERNRDSQDQACSANRRPNLEVGHDGLPNDTADCGVMPTLPQGNRANCDACHLRAGTPRFVNSRPRGLTTHTMAHLIPEPAAHGIAPASHRIACSAG